MKSNSINIRMLECDLFTRIEGKENSPFTKNEYCNLVHKSLRIIVGLLYLFTKSSQKFLNSS
jgi:hypothetical protein